MFFSLLMSKKEKDGEININLIYKGLHYMYRSVPVIRLECMKMSNINDFEETKVEEMQDKEGKCIECNIDNVQGIFEKWFPVGQYILCNFLKAVYRQVNPEGLA